MSSFPKKLLGRFLSLFKSEKQLYQTFRLITGQSPINLALYKQAMRHSSMTKTNIHGIKDSYERLEYLGDAILGMIVAEYLFLQYPLEEEGFLTEIRIGIINRQSLNQLAREIGLIKLIQFNQKLENYHSILGDCIEALIGAVYLDHGFHTCRAFVIKKLIKPHYDVDKLISTITNFKSQLLEWAQKENKKLHFEIINEKERKFTAQVFLDDHPMSKGFGYNKKKAEQDAAQKTCEQLKLNG